MISALPCTLEEGHPPFVWENGEASAHAVEYRGGPYAVQYLQPIYRKDTHPQEFAEDGPVRLWAVCCGGREAPETGYFKYSADAREQAEKHIRSCYEGPIKETEIGWSFDRETGDWNAITPCGWIEHSVQLSEETD